MWKYVGGSLEKSRALSALVPITGAKHLILLREQDDSVGLMDDSVGLPEYLIFIFDIQSRTLKYSGKTLQKYLSGHLLFLYMVFLSPNTGKI